MLRDLPALCLRGDGTPRSPKNGSIGLGVDGSAELVRDVEHEVSVRELLDGNARAGREAQEVLGSAVGGLRIVEDTAAYRHHREGEDEQILGPEMRLDGAVDA